MKARTPYLQLHCTEQNATGLGISVLSCFRDSVKGALCESPSTDVPSPYRAGAPTPEGTQLKSQEKGIFKSCLVSTLLTNQPTRSEQQNDSTRHKSISRQGRNRERAGTCPHGNPDMDKERRTLGGRVPARCFTIRTCPPAIISGVRAVTPQGLNTCVWGEGKILFHIIL